MSNQNFTIGLEVVRTTGDYVVGRKGLIVALDTEKSRAQVAWYGQTKTWVSFSALAPTSIPYQIVHNKTDKKPTYPKYVPSPKKENVSDGIPEKVMYKGIEVESLNFSKVVS